MRLSDSLQSDADKIVQDVNKSPKHKTINHLLPFIYPFASETVGDTTANLYRLDDGSILGYWDDEDAGEGVCSTPNDLPDIVQERTEILFQWPDWQDD